MTAQLAFANILFRQSSGTQTNSHLAISPSLAVDLCALPVVVCCALAIRTFQDSYGDSYLLPLVHMNSRSIHNHGPNDVLLVPSSVNVKNQTLEKRR
jgi:hypothetical protein